MNLFNVYPLWDIEPIKAKACQIWDKDGQQYLDLYGGHAVISIGHCHDKYTKALYEQSKKLGFYSNSLLQTLCKKNLQNV